MLRTSKVHYKSSELYPILHEHFGKSMNLARIKALSMMVCAICKVQRVTYSKLASAFDSNAASESSLRRIQRLIAQCEICIDLIAKLILKLILVQGPYNLTLDRTSWKFSNTNINILTLGIIYDGMAFPIVFKMMNKRGNANTRERIELLDRFIRLAGENSINHLMANREFIGIEWLGYLNARGVNYHIRNARTSVCTGMARKTSLKDLLSKENGSTSYSTTSPKAYVTR